MLLVNKRDDETGQFESTGELQNHSMRNLFSRNASYFDSEKENIESIAQSLTNVMMSPDSAVSIGKYVDDYNNFDGDKKKGSKKMVLIVVALLAVGALGVYGYYRMKSNAEG